MAFFVGLGCLSLLSPHALPSSGGGGPTNTKDIVGVDNTNDVVETNDANDEVEVGA
ncbi:MAG TPA: hypothetical protein VH062_02130 [Polyangiaceae bacterium]|jgi:hypothetical protein|nr:hypothetical protein [Polyangiaceae bacterium]